MAVADYSPPVSQLLTLGEVALTRDWADYRSMGLGPEHVPDLIRLALDEELYEGEPDSPEVWASVHAWRALGQLQAEAAVEPLLGLLERLGEEDDWAGEELPKVFGRIGPAAIPAVSAYLADERRPLFARVRVADGLQEIGLSHPEVRDECVAILAGQLERYAAQDPELNGFLISDLLDLQATEAAPVMERAFGADRVDLSIVGDWEEAQVELGLRTERETPARNWLLESLRSRSGEGMARAPQAAETTERLRPAPLAVPRSKPGGPSAKAKARAKRKESERARKRNVKRK